MYFFTKNMTHSFNGLSAYIHLCTDLRSVSLVFWRAKTRVEVGMNHDFLLAFI